jgi:hypothetical protein
MYSSTSDHSKQEYKMAEVKWKLRLNLKISEMDNTSTESPAIGLTDIVQQQGPINPFDIGETLTRSASNYLIRRKSIQTEDEGGQNTQT